jgi:hypothetical protein
MRYAVVVLACACSSAEETGDTPADSAVATDSAMTTETAVTDTTPGDASAEGIAAKYPGDKGIASDPSVIFADDFESYASASGLSANWNDGVYRNVRIATEAANVFAGKQALEFTNPKQDAELSNAVARHLDKELDALFLRYYTRYDPRFDVVGSTHNGGGISAHYYVGGMATPGVPADGKNKFLMEFEAWRGEVAEPNPGNLNVYIYHPEQRSMWGDHFFPDGTVLPNSSMPGNFGSSFVARPNVVPELGRWYCHEIMLKANTPGMRDGEIALWVDGNLIARFPNLRLRDVDTLKIDRFNLSLHIGSNTRSETSKWYDNVVAAKSYIGPMKP